MTCFFFFAASQSETALSTIQCIGLELMNRGSVLDPENIETCTQGYKMLEALVLMFLYDSVSVSQFPEVHCSPVSPKIEK